MQVFAGVVERGAVAGESRHHQASFQCRNDCRGDGRRRCFWIDFTCFDSLANESFEIMLPFAQRFASMGAENRVSVVGINGGVIKAQPPGTTDGLEAKPSTI